MSINDSGPIRSTLASDPDFVDLVQQFVENLPARHSEIVANLASGDLQKLQRSFHQLRGACGGYGFSSLSEMAANIEEKIRRGIPIDAIKDDIDLFSSALLRVTADPGN